MSASASTARHFRTGGWLAILAALLVIIPAAAVVVTLLDLRTYSLKEARRATTNLGAAIAEQTARTMQAVDLVLQEMRERVVNEDVATPAAFVRFTGSEETHQFLAGRLASLPQADSVLVVGADGRLTGSSRNWPAPDFNLADREYFRHLSQHDDRSVYISAPLRNRLTGDWTLFLARRVDGPNGAFLGVVLGAIRLRYLEDFYKAVTAEQSWSIELLRRDGLSLARYPPMDDAIGQALHDEGLWRHAVAKGGGRFLSTDPDGMSRIMSVHPLRDYPLVVDVGISQRAALAHWRAEATFIAIGALLAIVVFLVLLRVLAVQWRRLEASQAAIAARNAELEAIRVRLEARTSELTRTSEALKESEQRLATTLEHMDQGLLMVDADRVVAVCNRRAIELLNLPADMMRSNPAFADVLAYQWGAKEFALTSEKVQDFIRAGGILDQFHTYERRRPTGTMIEVRSTPLPGGGVVRTYTDITDRKAAEDQIRYFARHDQLTGLSNRTVFLEQLAQAVPAGDTGAGEVAVLFLDLDRFKLVNDTRGHVIGDRLLAQVARRMRGAVREGDTLARVGGDEFAIVLPHAGQEEAASLAARLVVLLAEPFELDGQRAAIGVSIGIARYPQDGRTPDALLRNADTALYRAKEDGRSTWRFFQAEMDARQQERFLVEQELREAIANRQFALAYQPICEPVGRTITGFEALLRWHHPVRGQIGPSVFVKLAEESGLIVPLGRWALETACAEAASWPVPVRLAVNLSPVHFRQKELPGKIAAILRRTGLSAERLDLEVTESLLLHDTGQVLQIMNALKQQGIGITLDDFGTAHASLSYLRSFPFDRLKIDQSFVQGVATDEEALAIVQAILTLAHSLRLLVTAEGVEVEQQLGILQRLHCDQVQGFLTGRPMTAEEVRAHLGAHGRTAPGLLAHDYAETAAAEGG